MTSKSPSPKPTAPPVAEPIGTVAGPEASATAAGTLTGTAFADVAAPAGPASREPRFYTALLVLATLGVCIAVITPVLASMAFKLQHITADPAAAVSQLGVILGLGALFALLANPIVGRLSDRTTSRFGMRRPWIVGGSVVGLVSLVGVGTATSPLLVGIAWFVTQAALNATIAALTATVADQVPVDRRGKVSGFFGLAIPLSILAGTALLSVLPTDLLRFAVPGAIGVALCVAFAAYLPDRVLTEKPAGRLDVRQIAGAFAFSPRRHPDFAWTWLSKFLVMFGYAGIATFYPLFLADRFGYDEAQTLQVIVLSNLINVGVTLVASPVAGWLSDRLQRRRVFVAIAGSIMVVGLVLLAFAPSMPLVYLAQGIIGLGIGAFTAVDLALGTLVLPNREDTAKDLGILNTANSLPQSIAPFVAPAVIAVGASTAIGGYQSWYLFGAIVSLVGAVLVYRVKSVR